MTDRAFTIALWAVLLAAIVSFDAAAHVSRSIPGASRAVGFVLRPIPGRIVVGLAWMWLGWHVFAR